MLSKSPFPWKLAVATMLVTMGSPAVCAQIRGIQVFGGHVLITGADGKQIVAPEEPTQENCRSPKIADDNRTVGWLVELPNCCTSYPVPLVLVIFRDGKVLRRFKPGQPIWDWQFVDPGRVAFWTGPTHGDVVPHCEMHDIQTGRLLQSWNGRFDDAYVPRWAVGLNE